MKTLLPMAALAWASAISSGTAHAQTFTPMPYSGTYSAVKPFGYGPVLQFLAAANKGTGDSQCHAISQVIKCLSVSGGNSCSVNVPAGQLVSCGSSLKPAVDETLFQPVNCYNQQLGDGGRSGLLGPSDFCTLAGYMPNRTTDTVYQYTDYVRLGVNRRFGGTIMELYGTDKLDRIMQNPGGAMQLSLWAYDLGYMDPTYGRYFAAPKSNAPYNRTPYAAQADCQAANPGSACLQGVDGPNWTETQSAVACSGNGATAGSPLNPIQGQSPGCGYGLSGGTVDSVSQPAPGQITMVKSNPSNFTFSSTLNGLTWSQTTAVNGPYALVTYKMANNGNLPNMDYQEIPALFLHEGMNKYTYFYGGSAAYQNATSTVSRVQVNQTVDPNTGGPRYWALQFPHRTGPFSVGNAAMLTEDWVSTCDSTETKCVTVATFSSSSQDIVVNNDQNGPYFGVRGFFSLTNQLNRTVTVAIFPYRFDQTVAGQTIRQWIYQLHNVKAYQQ
jgi:hypothetical protein